MKVSAAVPRRTYRMTTRAEAAAATGGRILDAAAEVFWERPAEGISLDEVARRAEVSVQTVIRRFGGKDGLFEATARREADKVRSQRDLAPVGDARGAVSVLVDHYEAVGDRVLRMLAEEERLPRMAEVVEQGRALHRDRCERVFAQTLEARSGVERRRLLAQLVAVCDVYMWKLLRKDAGLSRRQTELALVGLLNPLLEAS